jgi:hypothetical protein
MIARGFEFYVVVVIISRNNVPATIRAYKKHTVRFSPLWLYKLGKGGKVNFRRW